MPTRSVYPIRIAIVYYSRFGAVAQLAQHIADGAREVAGVEVRQLRVGDEPLGGRGPGGGRADTLRRRAAALDQLTWADAIVVGSPGYFGSMAAAVKELFEEAVTSALPPAVDRSRPWRQYLFRNKVGGAFTATATPHGGNEQAIHSILTLMMHLGMIVVTPGQGQPILENDSAPYGPTAVTGPEGDWPLTEAVQDQARRFGRHIAEITLWLRLGQARWPAPDLAAVGPTRSAPSAMQPPRILSPEARPAADGNGEAREDSRDNQT